MIFDHLTVDHIYLYRQPVDMRKGCDGLASIVATEMELEPCSTTLFCFINRSKDKMKLLLWDRNGFWVFYKRLIKQRFHWPDWFDQTVLTLSDEQVALLIQGFNLNGMRPHHKLELAFSF